MHRLVALFATVILPFLTIAQCKVIEKVLPDGTMYYHGETNLFYKTSAFSLSGNIVTDKENYFLNFQPKPFPDKSIGSKLKTSLEVVLENDSTYEVKLFDTFYRDEDTSFSILYVFDRKQIDPFRRNDVKEVRIDLGDGRNSYIFKLHKDVLRRQLECFNKPKNTL